MGWKEKSIENSVKKVCYLTPVTYDRFWKACWYKAPYSGDHWQKVLQQIKEDLASAAVQEGTAAATEKVSHFAESLLGASGLNQNAAKNFPGKLADNATQSIKKQKEENLHHVIQKEQKHAGSEAVDQVRQNAMRGTIIIVVMIIIFGIFRTSWSKAKPIDSELAYRPLHTRYVNGEPHQLSGQGCQPLTVLPTTNS